MDLMGKYLSRVKIKGREEELNPISDELLRDVFLETMDRLNESYNEGTLKYIQEHHPGLDDEINKADDRINETWKKCNNGGASIEGFKSTLEIYKTLYLKGIELFNDEVGTEGLNAAEIGLKLFNI
jgi:hypothetical protein